MIIIEITVYMSIYIVLATSYRLRGSYPARQILEGNFSRLASDV
jgi:hypothetical protein